MKKEYFDLYDKNRIKLNKTMIRGEDNFPGEYYLVVNVWIRNSKNQYLIQQRNKSDDLIQNQWATTSGAVLVNENSLAGALRETKEELGIELEANQLRLIRSDFINDSKGNYIIDIYLVKEDIDLDNLKLDSSEVKAVAYKTMNEINKMIQNNQFWDYASLLGRLDYFDILEKSN